MVNGVLAKRHQAAEKRKRNPPWRLRRGTARNIQLRGQILRCTDKTTQLTMRLVEHKVDQISAIIASVIQGSKVKTIGPRHVRYALNRIPYRRFIPTSIAATKFRVKPRKRAPRKAPAAVASGAPAAPEKVKKSQPVKKAAESAPVEAAAAAAPAAAEPDTVADVSEEDLVQDA